MKVLDTCGSKPSSSYSSQDSTGFMKGKASEEDKIRVQTKALKALLKECQRTLDSLNKTDHLDNYDDSAAAADDSNHDNGGEEDGAGDGDSSPGSSYSCRDRYTEELRDMIESRLIESDFLQKVQKIKLQASASHIPEIAEEGSSWDLVREHDLWEGGNGDLDEEDYVLVRKEDIVDGMAGFMAAYLLSLEHSKVDFDGTMVVYASNKTSVVVSRYRGITNDIVYVALVADLTPDQLQQALSKAFSVKKRKGKLRKALDGSKVIYNVASWSATAIGIYQNPALLSAASTAFWASCRIVSKFF